MGFSQEYIEDKLKDISKITTFILEGNDVSLLYREDHTDALLEVMVKGNIRLFRRILNSGFPNKQKKYFFYIHHAIRTKNFKFVKELIDHYKKHDLLINEIDNDNLSCFDIINAIGDFEDKNEMIELLKKEIQ